MTPDELERASQYYRDLRESDERAERWNAALAETETDDVQINDLVIGHLSELPLWAQAYIKHLRRKLLNATWKG